MPCTPNFAQYHGIMPRAPFTAVAEIAARARFLAAARP
jgi:hypothetical protein